MTNSNTASNNSANNTNEGNNMTQKDILIQIHNAAEADISSKLDVDLSYLDAVLNCYEEVLEQLGIQLTDELEDAIFYMANTNCVAKSVEQEETDGAEGKLDKHPSNDINTNPSEDKITMTNTTVQSTMFNTAFNADYSEVSSLVSFSTIVSNIVNHNGYGVRFADIIADVLFNVTTEEAYVAKLKRNFKDPSDEMIAKKWATQSKVNARAIESRDAFLALFGNKLGNLAPCSLAYEQTGFANLTAFPHNVLKFVKAAFTIVKIKANGDRECVGVAFNASNPEYKLPVNAGGFWVALIAAATYNLSAEERAQFTGFLFNNCASVSGTVVKRDRVEIDMLNATVSTGSRVLKANKASCFGQVGSEFVVLDGNHAVFLFALSAFAGTSKQLETRINLAVKLFMPEHNYGHKPDADDIAHFVRTNLIYANGINLVSDDHFGLEFIGGKQAPSFLGWCLAQGIVAASDKTNIKFVTINDGAEATGLGWNRELDRIITPNDVNKVAKLINRGAANNYDCADLDDRVASNFGFALQSGEVAKTKGKMMDVAFTNSKLGFGSGVGIINPETYITYYVGKKESESFTLSIFGNKFMNHANNKLALVNKIQEKIDAAKGQTFAPKATIVEVSVDGVKHKLVRNSSDAANIRVVSGTVGNIVNDENSIEISINVEIVETTQWVKTRRFATKFTTLPYEVEFVGQNNHWDIMLNNECTKGHGALLEMFANDQGEFNLHTANGELVGADGSVINLYDENNAVQEWKESKRFNDVKIRMTMAKSVFEKQAKAGNAEEGHSFFDSVKVISEGTTFDGYEYVLVEETIDVIFGQLVFDVEISTALESVSKSSFTLESAAAVSIQDKELGDALFTESIDKTKSFLTLANEFAGNTSTAPCVIDATTEDMSAVSSTIFPNGTIGIKHRKLLVSIANFFAGQNEYKFFIGKSANVKSIKLDLNVVAIYGSFSAASGAAARETATIVNFIVDLFINRVNQFDGDIVGKLNSAYSKIINTAVESNNVLKKATRSGDLVYGKVRTSFHPMLHSADGIPTVILNRNCPIVRLLGVKDWDSFVNYYIGFTRTPMPFLGAGRLVLTDDEQICGIAHVVVDPLVWHALNEGDSDGDGIAVINLETVAGYEITTDKVIAINASKMGIAGYEYLYGANVPYIDFISEKDKQGKKSLRGNACLLNSQLKDPETNEKVYITSAYLGDFAARVAKHYKSAVGVSYGMCSKLIFDAADRAVGPDEARFNTVVDASLIAWRAIYEGLGLSGYSKNAELFFNLVNAASTDTESEMVWSPMGNWKQVDVRFNTPKEEWCDGAILLQAAIKEIVGVNLPEEVFTQLIRSRIVTRVMPKLEGFGEVKKWWQGGVTGAVKFGALRRISQGSQRAAYEMGFIEEAEYASSGQYVAKPLAILFNEGGYSHMFDNALLGELSTAVCEFHGLIRDAKQANIDRANYGV